MKGRGVIGLCVIILVSGCMVTPIFTLRNALADPIDQLPFRQVLEVPIDTDSREARFQPVDLRVEFVHDCWARNESQHAVRIAYGDGSELTEIESQIYDLDYRDETQISACSIVFLIPRDATGKEKYYVLYDDSEIPPAEYPDHLTVEDTHYYYEPISGQKIDFDYYKITEDGFVVYGICQKGVLLGNGVSQMVAKLKLNATEFETFNTDQLGDFSMTYSIEGGEESEGSDWATDISKTVMVEGNLMIRLRIEGISPEETIKTDNIYTYYYCPGTTKRLAVNVNHEVLKTVEISGNMERDGSYATLTTFKSRSATIENMNIGVILPSLHVYSEDNIVKEYAVPPDPSSEKEEWILSTADDIDVGQKGWLCLDDPATGKAHGLIFESNQGFLPGDDDGLQVKTMVQEVVKLPGLEADAGSILATRNAYERGGAHDIIMDDTINTTFNVEFVTFETAGYVGVDKEASLFQNLIDHRPIFRGNVSGEEEMKDRYELTTYVHLAPSAPLGSVLSAVTGKNVSYLYAELFRTGSLQSSGSVGRLSLSEGMNLEFENTTLAQKLRLLIDLFDWGNASLVKKIRFPNLDAGRYLIKIYRENPFFTDDHQYIGYASVDLVENMSTHIYARPEGRSHLIVTNQQGNGVVGVKALLSDDNVTVATAYSDGNGSVLLKAPRSRVRPYTLRIIYQGFLLKEETVRLVRGRTRLPRPQEINISLYSFTLKVTDTWGLAPAVEINPMLLSNEMVESMPIFPTTVAPGSYLFSHLYPAQYRLAMGYKSVNIEEDVAVQGQTTRSIIFPAEFAITVCPFNSRGNKITEGEVSMTRNGHMLSADISHSGKAIVSLPPGTYTARIETDGKEVAQQVIDVKGKKTVSIVTQHTSFIYTLVIVLGMIGIGIAAVLFLLKKKHLMAAIKLAVIGLIMIALVSSWWTLEGEQSHWTTTTNTRLIPAKIVTITTDDEVAGGNISSVPPEFSLVLMLIALLLMLVALLVFTQVWLEEKHARLGIVLGLLSIILVCLSLVLFQYAMSQVTQVGVGGFSGSGKLEVSIPGDLAGSKTFSCSWGPGIGFYLGILVAVLLVLCFVYKYKKRLYLLGEKVCKSIRNIRSKRGQTT